MVNIIKNGIKSETISVKSARISTVFWVYQGYKDKFFKVIYLVKDKKVDINIEKPDIKQPKNLNYNDDYDDGYISVKTEEED